MSSPTTRSLKHLRDLGWTAEVVEKWLPRANKRKDLFGFIDIVAIKGDVTLGVQCTSKSNMSARVKKIMASPIVLLLFRARWKIVVQGWHKRLGRWTLKEVDVGAIPHSQWPPSLSSSAPATVSARRAS